MEKLLKMRAVWPVYLAMFGLGFCLGACDSNSTDAAAAIQSYYQALVAKNAEKLVGYSCTSWEDNARTELESLGAVEVRLEDLQCQVNGEQGEATAVSCSGKIIANYGNEVLEIDLAERQYLAQYEDGDWRMCGYR
jgi:hypothetical protein